MSKKDFSSDSDVFNAMFSMSTIKEAEKKDETQLKKEVAKTKPEHTEKKVTVTKKNIVPVNTIKERKSKRFNFYLESTLTDYFDNIKWIKRVQNTSDYINKLIREDFIKTLEISKDSDINEIENAWQKYKKENNL